MSWYWRSSSETFGSRHESRWRSMNLSIHAFLITQSSSRESRIGSDSSFMSTSVQRASTSSVAGSGLIESTLRVAYSTPSCVARFMEQPSAAAKLTELQKVESWKQREFIEAGGWATPRGGKTQGQALPLPEEA